MKKFCTTLLALLLCLCLLAGCDRHEPGAPVTEEKKAALLSELGAHANEAASAKGTFSISQKESSAERTSEEQTKGYIAGMVSREGVDLLLSARTDIERKFDGDGHFSSREEHYMLAFLRSFGSYSADGELTDLFAPTVHAADLTLEETVDAFRGKGSKLKKQGAGLRTVMYLPPEVYAASVAASDCTALSTEEGYELTFDLMALAEQSLKSLKTITEKLKPSTTLLQIFKMEEVHGLLASSLEGVSVSRLRGFLQNATHVSLPAEKSGESSLEWVEITLKDAAFFSRLNADGVPVSFTATTLGAVTITELFNKLIADNSEYGNLMEEKDVRELLRTLSEELGEMLKSLPKWILKQLFAGQTAEEGAVISPEVSLQLCALFDVRGKLSGAKISGNAKGTLTAERDSAGPVRFSLEENFSLDLGMGTASALTELGGML